MNLLDSVFALFNKPELTSAYVAFLASLLLCIAVVLTKRWHGALSMGTTDGIQKFHTAPRPRIGGIPSRYCERSAAHKDAIAST